MVTLGFLNPANVPTDDLKQCLPSDLHCPPEAVLEKTVIFFRDESTFQRNEDQPTFWGTKGTRIIKPKSKGAGIMVSDFIEERNGYLALTKDECDRAKCADPTVKMQARVFLEYDKSKEG